MADDPAEEEKLQGIGAPFVLVARHGPAQGFLYNRRGPALVTAQREREPEELTLVAVAQSLPRAHQSRLSS
jgi:hypothetical protein